MKHPFVAPHELQLVVMLTNNDFTVDNAPEIFEECKDSEARFWGMKEVGLPEHIMKDLYAKINAAGKTSVLEVVGYSEEEGVKGAQLAALCGCNILMGTTFSKKIADICHAHDMLYFPFVGKITGRPSVLAGNIGDIVREARDVLAEGADGVDLLGYRYVGDAVELNRKVCEALPCKVCIAGSVDSYQRLDEVKATGAPLFTIGGAFFDQKFGNSFLRQINAVCQYIKQ